jgi:membrane-associated phospholipid phosphatase
VNPLYTGRNVNPNRTIGTFVLALGLVTRLAAQDVQEPPQQTTPPAAPVAPTAPTANPDRPVDWVKMVPNVFHDQLKIWSFPARLTKRRVLVPTLVVVGITAALVATDAHTGGYFRSTNTFNPNVNRLLTGNATLTGIIATPASFYLLGLIRGNSYAQHSALLAGEAVLDSEIVATLMKDMDHRARPAEFPGGVVESGTWFNGHGPWLLAKGSFPSGHAIAAFSVATVMARRYPHQRWLPYVAYGLASIVGFSRLTLGAHFPSDVFAGSVLGYAISRFVVLRQ